MKRQRFKFLTSDKSKVFQKNCEKANIVFITKMYTDKHKLVYLKLKFHVLSKVDSGI